ncbi:MAG: N-acetyltransferase [Micavibrio aeruginosavorus]|uniref:N-acetyltransferase n=1 Tax=Micavibrio aeruginosavorus TaxID=349221 RepID=A0A2W5FP52_9BACT|nr:MAG: N-acetyltransferase [Micavibrio aeruginosavorus]
MGKIIDNTIARRFEMDLEGQIVFANYRIDQNILFINYVESPPELRGTGAAGKLMEGIMGIAKERSYKVVPICSYAVSWIRRHEEYQSLLV